MKKIDAMAKRKLGQTKVEVTRLGFGGNAIGNLYEALDEAHARDAVQAAIEQGINYFDTAPLYGHGLSERRMGDILRGVHRDSFVLSTKVGRLLRPHGRMTPPKLSLAEGGIFACELPFQPHFDFSYDAVMRSAEDSLQRLGLGRIDVLLIHDCDEWSQKEDYAEALRTVEKGALRALQKLKSEGVIEAFGAGVNQYEACENLMDIGPFDCFLLAGRYTLLEQQALDTFLPRCVAENVSVILGAPYNSGILATGSVENARYNYAPAPADVLAKVKTMEQICKVHGVKLPAAALQFVLAHPAVTTVIPGARSRAETEMNLKLVESPIPSEFWDELKAQDLIRADAPCPV